MFGGEVLRGFSLALLIGIIVGTYSSVAIASPIMVWWEQRIEAANRAAALKLQSAKSRWRYIAATKSQLCATRKVLARRQEIKRRESVSNASRLTLSRTAFVTTL